MPLRMPEAAIIGRVISESKNGYFVNFHIKSDIAIKLSRR